MLGTSRMVRGAVRPGRASTRCVGSRQAASRTGKGLLRSETAPLPDALLPRGIAHGKPELLRRALPPHRCLAGPDARGAGGFSQAAKCEPYYFWISKTIINT